MRDMGVKPKILSVDEIEDDQEEHEETDMLVDDILQSLGLKLVVGYAVKDRKLMRVRMVGKDAIQ